MPKWLRVCLWVIGTVVYLNIGYLFAYSLDSTASQTMLSDSVYKTVDFMGVMGKAKDLKSIDYILFYGAVGFFWPFCLFLFWLLNFYGIVMGSFSLAGGRRLLEVAEAFKLRAFMPFYFFHLFSSS